MESTASRERSPAWRIWGARFDRVVLKGDITPRPFLAVAAVLVATLMTSFHTRLFAMALADLRGVWRLSFDQGAELNTVAQALQLLIAPAIPLLCFIFGSRRVLLSCALAFAFVTALTPFASGQAAVFVLHGVTAILLGCFIPATLATVFTSLPPKLWLIALSIYTVRLTFALHSGVSIVGFYVEDLGWQSIYWQASISGLVVAALVVFGIPQAAVKWAAWKGVDKGSAAMFCVALTMIYAGLDEGNRLDWFNSGEIVALIGGGLVLFGVFLAWQWVTPAPFAHPRVLKRNVILAMLAGACFGFLCMASALLVPNFLGTVGGLKAEQSGDSLLLVVALQVIFVPLAIVAIKRIDARLTLAFGIVCMMVGCYMGTQITHDWASADFTGMMVAFAAGNAFTFLSVMTIAVANATPSDIIGVLAYAQIPRVLGPTLASALIVTGISKREQLHSALLTPYVDMARAQVADRVAQLGGSLGQLDAMVRKESYVLAFNDLFAMCFLVGLVGLVVAACMAPAPPNSMTPSGYRSVVH